MFLVRLTNHILAKYLAKILPKAKKTKGITMRISTS
jgi:hypothetical protein